MPQGPLDELIVKIGADITELQKGMAQAIAAVSKATAQMQKSFEGLQKTLSSDFGDIVAKKISSSNLKFSLAIELPKDAKIKAKTMAESIEILSNSLRTVGEFEGLSKVMTSLTQFMKTMAALGGINISLDAIGRFTLAVRTLFTDLNGLSGLSLPKHLIQSMRSISGLINSVRNISKIEIDENRITTNAEAIVFFFQTMASAFVNQASQQKAIIGLTQTFKSVATLINSISNIKTGDTRHLRAITPQLVGLAKDFSAIKVKSEGLTALSQLFSSLSRVMVGIASLKTDPASITSLRSFVSNLVNVVRTLSVDVTAQLATVDMKVFTKTISSIRSLLSSLATIGKMQAPIDFTVFATSVGELIKQLQRVAPLLPVLQQVNTAFRQVSRSGQTVAQQTQQITSIWGFAGKTANDALVSMRHTGFALMLLGNQINQSLKQVFTRAIDFESGMTKINTVAHVTEKQLKSMADTIVKVGVDTGKGLFDVQAAVNVFVQSGFDVKESMALIEPAAILAAGGYSLVSDSAQALQEILNAFSLSATNATDVTDILFKTVEEGNITIDNIVQGFGKLAAAGAAAGLSLEDVSSTVAIVSRISPPERAMTETAAFFDTFIGSTDDAKKAAAAFGIELSATYLKEKGLVTIIKQLSALTAEQREEIFSETRARRAVNALVESGSRGLSVYTAMQDRAGSSAGAFAKRQMDAEFQVSKLKSTIDAFSSKSMVGFLDTLTPVIAGINYLLERFVALTSETGSLGAAIGNMTSMFVGLTLAATTVAATLFVLQGLMGGAVWTSFLRVFGKIVFTIGLATIAFELLSRMVKSDTENFKNFDLIIFATKKKINELSNALGPLKYILVGIAIVISVLLIPTLIKLGIAVAAANPWLTVISLSLIALNWLWQKFGSTMLSWIGISDKTSDALRKEKEAADEAAKSIENLQKVRAATPAGRDDPFLDEVIMGIRIKEALAGLTDLETAWKNYFGTIEVNGTRVSRIRFDQQQQEIKNEKARLDEMDRQNLETFGKRIALLDVEKKVFWASQEDLVRIENERTDLIMKHKQAEFDFSISTDQLKTERLNEGSRNRIQHEIEQQEMRLRYLRSINKQDESDYKDVQASLIQSKRKLVNFDIELEQSRIDFIKEVGIETFNNELDLILKRQQLYDIASSEYIDLETKKFEVIRDKALSFSSDIEGMSESQLLAERESINKRINFIQSYFDIISNQSTSIQADFGRMAINFALLGIESDALAGLISMFNNLEKSGLDTSDAIEAALRKLIAQSRAVSNEIEDSIVKSVKKAREEAEIFLRRISALEDIGKTEKAIELLKTKISELKNQLSKLGDIELISDDALAQVVIKLEAYEKSLDKLLSKTHITLVKSSTELLENLIGNMVSSVSNTASQFLDEMVNNLLGTVDETLQKASEEFGEALVGEADVSGQFQAFVDANSDVIDTLNNMWGNYFGDRAQGELDITNLSMEEIEKNLSNESEYWQLRSDLAVKGSQEEKEAQAKLDAIERLRNSIRILEFDTRYKKYFELQGKMDKAQKERIDKEKRLEEAGNEAQRKAAEARRKIMSDLFAGLLKDLIAFIIKKIAIEIASEMKIIKINAVSGAVQIHKDALKKFGLPGIIIGAALAAGFLALVARMVGGIEANIPVDNTNRPPPGEGDGGLQPEGLQHGGLVLREGTFRIAEQNRPELVIPLAELIGSIDAVIESRLSSLNVSRNVVASRQTFGMNNETINNTSTTSNKNINVNFSDVIDLRGAIVTSDDRDSVDRWYKDILLPAKERHLRSIGKTVSSEVELF